jgi:hypothetical protein
MKVLVSMTLPEIYYSLNTERYARSFMKHNHPELTFLYMEGRYAVCERVIEDKPSLRQPKNIKASKAEPRLL